MIDSHLQIWHWRWLSTKSLRIWTSFIRHDRPQPKTVMVTQISFRISWTPYFLVCWTLGKKLACVLAMSQWMAAAVWGCISGMAIALKEVYFFFLYFSNVELGSRMACIQIALIKQERITCSQSQLCRRIVGTCGGFSDCVFYWGSLWSSRDDSCKFYKQIQSSQETTTWWGLSFWMLHLQYSAILDHVQNKCTGTKKQVWQKYAIWFGWKHLYLDILIKYGKKEILFTLWL